LLHGLSDSHHAGVPTAVMRFAGDAPTMASAANIAAFNLGTIGSALGGAGSRSGWRRSRSGSAWGWRWPARLAFTNSHDAR